MKNVTVSLDDDTYRKAKRRTAENDRSLSSVVREALCAYGAQESDFDRLKRMQDEFFMMLDARGGGVDAPDRWTREEVNDRALMRAQWTRGPE